MKNTLRLFLFFLILSGATTLKSQNIISYSILPPNPVSSQILTLALHTGFNYSDCLLANHFVSFNGNTIYVSVYFQTGILTVLCDRTDNLFIANGLPAGTYNMEITIYVSGPSTGSDNASFSFLVSEIDPCLGVNVDDGNACTIDVCDPSTGNITHTDATPVVFVSPGTILCYGGTTCIEVTASGGSPLYTGTGTFCDYHAGSYTFEVIDDRGCSVTSAQVDISEPGKLSVLTTSTPSSGSDGTATATPVGGTPGYTYLWTPGMQTTQSATGLSPQDYNVWVTDTNGCMSTSIVTVLSVCDLTPPAPITGTAGVCAKQSGLYCVTPNPSATSFIWSPLPAGVAAVGATDGPCITLKFSTKFKGGFICAKGVSSCGTTQSACLNVVPITKKPVTPGIISGPTSLCPNVSDTYTISPVPLASSYLWSVSGNMQILSGQGTTSVVVIALSNFNGGYVKVKAVNCKDKSGERRLNVSKSPGCRRASDLTHNKSVISGEELSEVSVFPNPTSGKLTVLFYSGSTSRLLLKITDLPGKTIVSYMVDAVTGENRNDIFLSNVSKGMYFLTLLKNGIEMQSIKIIVE